MFFTFSHFFLYRSNTINNCITPAKNVMLFSKKNDLIEKKPNTTPPIIGAKIFDKDVAVWFKALAFEYAPHLLN